MCRSPEKMATLCVSYRAIPRGYGACEGQARLLSTRRRLGESSSSTPLTTTVPGPERDLILTWRAQILLHHRRARVVSSLEPSKGKGFGKKNVIIKRQQSVETAKSPGSAQDVGEKSRGRSQEEYDGVPEVVTNRMLKRISLTVGLPLAIGVLFFPLFYYLKAVKNVDIPEWLPFLVSLFTFGAAGFGITYGVVSSSWDPLREGSLLGWKEAQANWPVFWETVQGKEGRK